MSKTIPSFSDLLLSVENQFPSEWQKDACLTEVQVEQLERISSAASESAGMITSGLAALGELLAWVGTTGEFSNESLTSTGWLIQHLADTAGQLHHESQCADYKLHTLPRSAPQKTTTVKRGAGGAAC
ncbi:hypothetical protein M6G63_18755 [Pseudomonas sp. BYT-5]|uniref:hypothetical protein n=1 Tax=unclassified Pseudomonas TaxID=196821 RepID=UPI0020221CF8|nr:MULTISPECIES: hypothetical protein [unclassified Pseudomonas]URD41466.1 hypothetical protein M6G63_18755 [Pseudomonas sp. BYT-5]URK96817.1 hypothetical protein J5X93_19420 [Pseudomonas sp. BYT-1]